MSAIGKTIQVVHPLFAEPGDGELPTSPMQLEVGPIDRKMFALLNAEWHSRLPIVTNCFEGVCFGASYKNRYYAVAWWSDPVARALDHTTIIELRRMAICDEAPRNTASRFLAQMLKSIKKTHPHKSKAISYQDTDVHHGTIYKASNWVAANQGARIDESKKYNNWKTRKNRMNQSTAPKVRWEKLL